MSQSTDPTTGVCILDGRKIRAPMNLEWVAVLSLRGCGVCDAQVPLLGRLPLCVSLDLAHNALRRVSSTQWPSCANRLVALVVLQNPCAAQARRDAWAFYPALQYCDGAARSGSGRAQALDVPPRVWAHVTQVLRGGVLTTLCLNGAGLKTKYLPAGVWACLSNLAHLDVSHNRIADAERSVLALQSARALTSLRAIQPGGTRASTSAWSRVAPVRLRGLQRLNDESCCDTCLTPAQTRALRDLADCAKPGHAIWANTVDRLDLRHAGLRHSGVVRGLLAALPIQELDIRDNPWSTFQGDNLSQYLIQSIPTLTRLNGMAVQRHMGHTRTRPATTAHLVAADAAREATISLGTWALTSAAMVTEAAQLAAVATQVPYLQPLLLFFAANPTLRTAVALTLLPVIILAFHVVLWCTKPVLQPLALGACAALLTACLHPLWIVAAVPLVPVAAWGLHAWTRPDAAATRTSLTAHAILVAVLVAYIPCLTHLLHTAAQVQSQWGLPAAAWWTAAAATGLLVPVWLFLLVWRSRRLFSRDPHAYRREVRRALLPEAALFNLYARRFAFYKPAATLAKAGVATGLLLATTTPTALVVQCVITLASCGGPFVSNVMNAAHMSAHVMITVLLGSVWWAGAEVTP